MLIRQSTKFWIHELHPGEAIAASISAIIDSMVKTILKYSGRLLEINQIIMMFNVEHTLGFNVFLRNRFLATVRNRLLDHMVLLSNG